MFRTEFDKNYAQRCMECILEGKPLMPSRPGGWNHCDLTVIAGVCAHLISTIPEGLAMVADPEYAKLEHENELLKQMRQSAEEGDFVREVLDAVAWAENLCDLIEAGVYEEDYEDTLIAEFTNPRLLTGQRNSEDEDNDAESEYDEEDGHV